MVQEMSGAPGPQYNMVGGPVVPVVVPVPVVPGPYGPVVARPIPVGPVPVPGVRLLSSLDHRTNSVYFLTYNSLVWNSPALPVADASTSPPPPLLRPSCNLLSPPIVPSSSPSNSLPLRLPSSFCLYIHIYIIPIYATLLFPYHAQFSLLLLHLCYICPHLRLTHSLSLPVMC